MMRHEEIRDRLGDFADGALAPAEHGELLDHLERCDDCRGELAGLHELRAAARALPLEIAPPRDLWPEIAARLQRSGAPRAGEDAARPAIVVDFRAPRSAAWRPRAALAAAAVLLVALSSGLTAVLVGGRGADAARMASARVAATPASPAADARANTALAAFRPTEMEYLGTVEALEGELAARRDQLSPQTVQVIEENLRIIDGAIAEARAALLADPASADLPLLLSGMYRTKVELLQRAVLLPAT